MYKKKTCLTATTALLLAACSSSDTTNTDSKTTLYTNAIVYTVDSDIQSAEAFAVKDGRISAVGTEEEVTEIIGTNTIETIDLAGKFVMPGLIDSHTHPGLVSVLGSPDAPDIQLPTTSKDELFTTLEAIAVATAEEPFLFFGTWDVAMFLPEGPDKKDLDRIFGEKPVILTDNSGHSFWLNSAAFALFGIDKNTPDLSPNLSVFVRDESGEPTGWVKEFALLPYLGDLLYPEESEIQQRLDNFLDYLSKKGVTALWDAGNFSGSHVIYSRLKALDDASRIPLRYEASHHIYLPHQMDNAVEELKTLRTQYESENLKFNSIKIHFDGVTEVATANMIDNYIGTASQGGALFPVNELADFMLELDQENIDLHLHSIGDLSSRKILDAVELAEERKGKELAINVTLAHLEQVHIDDLTRFARPGIYANFTPHWFGGSYFGDAPLINLGETRAHNGQLAASFFQTDANVTFSSDVTNHFEISRANPFLGIQMGMTRQEASEGTLAPVNKPEKEIVSLNQMINGYTINGAKQLGIAHETGSISVGKQADFIVLDSDPFLVDVYELQNLAPSAVYYHGKLVQGSIE